MGWKRKFGVGAAAIALLGATAFFAVAPGIVERGQNATLPGPWKVTPAAEALLARLTVADLHSDALLWDRDLRRESSRGHVDLPRLRQGNVAVQVFTTVTKSPKGQNYDSNPADAPDNITPLVIAELRPPRTWFSLSERALDQGGRLTATAAAAPEDLRILRSASDLQSLLDARATGAKTVGGILGIEGAHALEGDIANLHRLEDAGFRVFGLTHFFDNELGASLHGASGRDGAGLTDFGRQVVGALVARHLIIDLAHASPAMAREVLATGGAVPIVSHTGIFSHCQTPRNFADDILKSVAEKGGIVGIGFWDEVTCGSTPQAIADSIAAAVTLLGEDHVALGSDFDGAVTVPFDAGDMAVLVQALLDRGLDETVIAKVMGGNQIAYLLRALPG